MEATRFSTIVQMESMTTRASLFSIFLFRNTNEKAINTNFFTFMTDSER